MAPRARPSDPAFLLPSANGLDPLTHYVFVGSVKHCVQQVGLDPSGISGHSFRRGGATLAHRLGIVRRYESLERGERTVLDWLKYTQSLTHCCCVFQDASSEREPAT